MRGVAVWLTRPSVWVHIGGASVAMDGGTTAAGALLHLRACKP
jgi:hypothetical protein